MLCAIVAVNLSYLVFSNLSDYFKSRARNLRIKKFEQDISNKIERVKDREIFNKKLQSFQQMFLIRQE